MLNKKKPKKKKSLRLETKLNPRKVVKKSAHLSHLPKLHINQGPNIQSKKKLKKEISYGTSISINSSFSTAQNVGAFNNSNYENKFKPKRGMLTVQKDPQKMHNKYSHKNISIGSKTTVQKRICDSDRLPTEKKELYIAEQPNREKYETQKLIEEIMYDNCYSKKNSVILKSRKSNKKNNVLINKDPRKTKICLENSFKSDKETGFGQKNPEKEIAKANSKLQNDNTFSFNNLSETKFSSKKKPICKVKRPSRLVSENKQRTGSHNIFLDDEEEDQNIYYTVGKNTKNI
jgi:hypothetical protein